MKNFKPLLLMLIAFFSMSFIPKQEDMITDVEITPVPDVELVSLDLAKGQLRIETDFVEEDILIRNYIDASVENASNYVGKPIKAEILLYKLSKLETFIFKSTLKDEVVSIKYYPIGETELVTMDASLYKLRQSREVAENSELTFTSAAYSLPIDTRDDAVQIELKQGYTTASEVPKVIISAILLQVSEFYEKREDRAEINSKASHALLRNYRSWT